MEIRINISEDKELRDFIKKQVLNVMRTQIREEMREVIKEIVGKKLDEILERDAAWLLKQTDYIDYRGNITDKVRATVINVIKQQIASEYDAFIKEQVQKEEWIEHSYVNTILTNAIGKKVDNLLAIKEKSNI